ncbi:MAG TPA: branched-chain amino acid ABC transporter permease [Bradyrhizobium sp.]|nr:branched-chain amino acid ABC transporter permease [Bradyrhizobium sp.]
MNNGIMATSVAAPPLDEDGTPLPRPLSLMVATLILCSGFVLVVYGLKQTDAMHLVGLFCATAVLIMCGTAMIGHLPVLRDTLKRERTFLLAGILVCTLIYPFLANDPYQLHMLAIGGLFALMAIGLNVNVGFAGLADFGYIAYYAIGAYASALLNVRLGLDFWLCLPLAAVFTSALSMLVALPAVRVRGHYLALVTLGFSFIVIQLITNLEVLTGGTQGVFGIAPPSLFGHSFQQPLKLFGTALPYQANFYYLTVALLCLAVLVCGRLSASRWGRAWRAMRADEVAASAAGLNLMKLKLMAFGTGSSFGGIAGALYAHMIGYIDPSSFRVIESMFLLAVVAIGNWRIGGIIVSAVLFAILPEKLRAFDEWRLLIFGVLLLIVMLARSKRMLATAH